jgi:hypothetical protein
VKRQCRGSEEAVNRRLKGVRETVAAALLFFNLPINDCLRPVNDEKRDERCDADDADES